MIVPSGLGTVVAGSTLASVRSATANIDDTDLGRAAHRVNLEVKAPVQAGNVRRKSANQSANTANLAPWRCGKRESWPAVTLANLAHRR
uniref:Putative secreted protein n=1 Tax=Anopheles darlingi TaxID=43151 RepID=A0A2M4DHC2_ANODA